MRIKKLFIAIASLMMLGEVNVFANVQGTDDYIQNMTFNGNQIVLSSQGLAGSDVTTSVPQGPVIVESGKSTFQFTDKFVIKNDFEVKSGASLEIRSSN